MNFNDMTTEELNQLAEDARNAAAGKPQPYLTTLPTPSSPQDLSQGMLASADPYAPQAWGATEYDFKTPSGQLCRMKKIRPEDIIGTGVLDRITRLPGFAEELVEKAEGMPPKLSAEIPAKEDLEALLEVLDNLIPMVVVKPTVHQEPAAGEERVSGVVYVRDIDLADRVAIMERAVSGVKKLDGFRTEA